MNEYDVALKLTLQESAGVAISNLAGAPIARWLNVELPEIRNTRVDMLGETAEGLLVHIELQSTNNKDMPMRMAEYALRVYRVFGRLPRQTLLYVEEDPMRMADQLNGPDLAFRYRIVDLRDLDGELLLASDQPGDNILAILAGLKDRTQAVRRILERIAALPPDKRDRALARLLILAELRKLGRIVKEEAGKMPITKSILDHEVLGPEFRRERQEGRQEGLREGETILLRRQIEKRFGSLPAWAEEALGNASVEALSELGLRLLDARSLDDLLRPPR